MTVNAWIIELISYTKSDLIFLKPYELTNNIMHVLLYYYLEPSDQWVSHLYHSFFFAKKLHNEIGWKV